MRRKKKKDLPLRLKGKKKKNTIHRTFISSSRALSLASLSIASTRSCSLLLPFAYVWNVPDPAPAALPCTCVTTVGTFCEM